MAFHKQRIEQVFSVCLELMETGQGNVDSLLKHYPDQADRLRPGLEAAFWLIERRCVFDPRPGYVPVSRRRMVFRIRQEKVAVVAHSRQAGRGSFWATGATRLLFQLALLVIAVVSLTIGGSGFAFATRAALPGDSLYGMKLTAEKAELAAARDTETAAQLQIKYARQRMVEIQTLILEGSYGYVPETVDRFESHVQLAVQAVNAVAQVKTSQAKMLANSLQATLSSQLHTLLLLAEVVPLKTGQEIERTRQVSEQGVFGVQALLEDTSAYTTPAASPTPSVEETPVGAGEWIVLPPVQETSAPEATATPTGTPTATFTATATVKPALSLKLTPTQTTRPKPRPKSTQSEPAQAPSNTPAPQPVPSKTFELTQAPPTKGTAYPAP